ncbi:alpha-1,4-polygalactosaminidase [Selenomonas sp. TAMA-11512]|uniref:endo alpha-1,4 polygalactosaminidase n=1 Tax=Selenomonas sp. TAMA-11512 TaxID=3095337 RepID=UPI00308E06BE|nr:alpha-1,4-polygalactosaminidase [Selenomonas sp. TAMA-11512]
MRKIKKGVAALLLGAAGFFGMHHAPGFVGDALKDASAHRAVVPETAMIDLTEKLGRYARGREAEFLLVGNGPVGLLEATEDNSEENVARLVGALDAFFMESIFYDGYEEDGKESEKNDADTADYLAAMLRKPLLAGKQVFTLDYVKGEKIAEVEALGDAAGYISEGGDRLLDVIPERAPRGENAADVTRLKQVKNFLVLLNPEHFSTRESYIEALAATNYDLLIVDLYYGDRPLTAEETSRLKRKANGGRRILLSYMSVGEAADYRPYWKKEWESERPHWLAEPNPEWPGSYKARYWAKEWHDLLYGRSDAYIDRIIAAGFDGAFLDVMDAWQYFK